MGAEDLRAPRYGVCVGCSAGGLERHARFLKFEAAFDSFDLSEQSLRLARDEAHKQGLSNLNYILADLNHSALEAERYGVVFASMSLHHLHRLEDIILDVRRSLRPGGLLIFNEFVGPRKFQLTDLQLALVTRLLLALPAHLRADLLYSGSMKREVLRPSIDEMDAIDPSEAALSDEILPIAERLFEPVARRDYGGTILHSCLIVL